MRFAGPLIVASLGGVYVASQMSCTARSDGQGCDQSIAAYCAAASPPPECGGIDAMIQAVCARHQDPAQRGETSCAGITFLNVHGVDTGTFYFFDTTGALVAVVSWGATGGGSTECLAGAPPGIARPADVLNCSPGACCMQADVPIVCPTVDAGSTDAARD